MGRWTDLAEWQGPTLNQGPAMVEQRGLVVHIAQGYFWGTIGYQKNPTVDVSSHFVVAGPRDSAYDAADGRLAQVVDTDIAAWTQRAGNGRWLSVECSGFAPQDALSAAQLESIAQLFARGHREYGWPLQVAHNPNERGLGHHSMGSSEGTCTWRGENWGHCDCPGAKIIAQKPAIVARAIAIVSGVTDMADVYYKVQSADADRNGEFWVSNRVHRRGPLRTRGTILGPAISGASEVVLTDTMRGADSWDDYLTAVAGPEFVCGAGGEPIDHKHQVELTTTASTLTGATGPAEPVV